MRQRVQKLLDQGVMQIVAVTDPLTVGSGGRRWSASTSRATSTPSPTPSPRWRRSSTWSSPPAPFDLLVEIVCEDDDHLLEMINKRIRALPGVRSTESFVYLKLRKQTYTWGTR